VIAALLRGIPGRLYNATDDEPVTQLALFEWLSRRLGQALPPKAASETARKRGATNKRVSNRRLKQELVYRLKFPTFREGYSSCR